MNKYAVPKLWNLKKKMVAGNITTFILLLKLPKQVCLKHQFRIIN